MYGFDISIASHRGPRDTLEDNAFAIQLTLPLPRKCSRPQKYIHSQKSNLSISIFGVLDGVGGQAGGEIASAVGAGRLAAHLTGSLTTQASLASSDQPFDPAPDDLIQLIEDALRSANEEIITIADSQPMLRNMASTAVCGVLIEQKGVIGWVGDSRAHRLHRGVCEQLTCDHSEYQRHVEAGRNIDDDFDVDPLRHVINRYLGQREAFDPETVCFHLAPDDLIVLCTDGLHDVVINDELAYLATSWLSESKPFVDLAGSLVNAALDRGTTDNTTVLSLRPEIAYPTPFTSTQTIIDQYPSQLASAINSIQHQEVF